MDVRIRVLSIGRDFMSPRTTAALGRAALGLDWSGVACAGGLENRPGLLRLLARRGELLGSPARAVAAVRDPAILFPFLRAARIAHAPVSFAKTRPARGGAWLLKRRRSAGGAGVRAAHPGERRLPGDFFQLRIEGRAGSAAFLASGGRAVLVGVAESLGPGEMPGAPPFRYAGSLVAPIGAFLGPAATQAAERAASALARRFGLRGLNGFDFVVERGVPRVIEVNPRWTASMELHEERLGLNLFDRHLEATEGRLPEAWPRGASRYAAKGILYATSPVAAPGPERLAALGARDRPRAGELFDAGRPICTLFAEGGSRAACLARLGDRVAAARRLLAPRRDAAAATIAASNVVSCDRSDAQPGRLR